MSFGDLLKNEAVQDLATALKPENLRLVGGCVRDGVLGEPSLDIDACTP